MGGWMDGWMGGWMDGWMGGWMGWMGGWVDSNISIQPVSPLEYLSSDATWRMTDNSICSLKP